MTVRMEPYGRASYKRGPVVNREPLGSRRARQPRAVPPSRKQRNGRRIFRRLLFATSVLLTLVIVGGGIAFWLIWVSLPLPADRVMSETSYITDASGEHRLASINAGENRTPVRLQEVPQVVTDAVLSTEDRNFYVHHGVDPVGVARALYVDLRGKSLQGGSTITQQYVKQAYVGRERTASRKVKEAILAVKLEQRLSKDQILERYLNIIYLGRGTYGIQTASRAYFGKDVQELGLKEATYLAGLIRGPEYADAYKSPENAALRRNLTVDSMVRDGKLPVAQAEEIKKTPLKSYVNERSTFALSAKPDAPGTEYFTQWVRLMLERRYGAQRVEAGGLQVKTTLDINAQRKAYDAIYGTLKPDEPAGALVSLDENGYVIAMVGGRDFAQNKVNLAVGTDGGGSGRHAGSTFKAFELASTLEHNGCLQDVYPAPGKITLPGWDSDPKKSQDVENYENEDFGYATLEDATAHSLNTVYAQLVMKDKPRNLVDAAKRAGITSPMGEHNSLVLGAVDVSPLEMAGAYLTFSQRGMRVTPNPILEVRNSAGEPLEKAKPQRVRAFDQDTADSVNYALQKVVQSGTGKRAQIGKPVAGKTGTTEDYGDAWFVGYTPKVVTAVWMGYPEGSSHKMTNVRGMRISGGTLPAQMFATYMRGVTADSSAELGFNPPKACSPTVHLSDGTTYRPDETTTTTTSPYLQDPFFPPSDNNGRGRGRSRTPTPPTTTYSLDGLTPLPTIEPVVPYWDQ